MANATVVPPVIHLEFRYKEIDTILAVGYAIASVVSLWTLISHMNSTTKDIATAGFYMLLCLASLVRAVWFSTPYSVHVSGYVPQRLHIFDEGWIMMCLSEVAEMLGTLLLYAIFILMVVFWADLLHRAFDPHGYSTPRPMQVFLSLLFFLVIFMSTGFALFAFDRIDSLLLLMYNDFAVALLSGITCLFVAIYSCRIRTVLIAFLEVSQIETTDRIQTVTRTGVLCGFFLLVNGCLETYMGLQMYHLVESDDSSSFLPQDSVSWWLLIMAKHLVEIFILYGLLYILWGSTGGSEATDSKSQSDLRRHYESIPDVTSSPSDAIARRSSSTRRFLEAPHHGSNHHHNHP